MADARTADDVGPRAGGVARVPPHNLQAEESLLGAMLLSKDAIAAGVELVGADDFYKPAHGHIFDAITALYGSGEPVDPVTVADELRRAGLLDAIGGPAVLVALQANTPATTSAARYAKIVEEHALLRRMIWVAGDIAERAYSLPDDVAKTIDEAESLVFAVAERRLADATAPIGDLLDVTLDRLEELYARGESITGIPTGYYELDELLSGLQPSALVVVGARPSMGKALALDTPIPTPDGWTTMGALRPGDRVVDDDGNPCRVTYATPVQYDRPCFELSFDDGSTMVADADHQWSAHDLAGWRARRRPRVVTTAQMVDEGVRAADGRANWYLSVAHPLELPDADLPVDPYVLGCGLGRGAAAVCAIDDRDHDHLAVELVLAGYAPDVASSTAAAADLAEGAIPAVYLRASAKQRLALLQGLLDTAGVVASSRGMVEVHLADRSLASQVRELACSLGHKPGRIRVRRAASPGGPAVTASVLRWAPPECVFRLPRKADALEARRDRSPFGASTRRTITAIRSVPSVPVRCITVDSPNHLYLAGESMIPTHNTAFALGIAQSAGLKTQRPVLLFSLEMSQLEVTQRILCAEAKVDATRVRNGKLSEADWSRIHHAVGRLANAQIFIDDNPNITVMDIRAKARRLKSRIGDLGIVIVDYIQLMSGRMSAENRQVEVSEISRNLKILARELECPVVALAQLNRQLETRADKRPMLADLRESGSIEQDADVVVFLYRDEVYNPDALENKGTAEILVAKHRSGPTGKVRLAWLEQYARFENMARGV